jgi:hypothetical protein
MRIPVAILAVTWYSRETYHTFSWTVQELSEVVSPVADLATGLPPICPDSPNGTQRLQRSCEAPRTEAERVCRRATERRSAAGSLRAMGTASRCPSSSGVAGSWCGCLGRGRGIGRDVGALLPHPGECLDGLLPGMRLRRVLT